MKEAASFGSESSRRVTLRGLCQQDEFFAGIKKGVNIDINPFFNMYSVAKIVYSSILYFSLEMSVGEIQYVRTISTITPCLL